MKKNVNDNNAVLTGFDQKTVGQWLKKKPSAENLLNAIDLIFRSSIFVKFLPDKWRGPAFKGAMHIAVSAPYDVVQSTLMRLSEVWGEYDFLLSLPDNDVVFDSPYFRALGSFTFDQLHTLEAVESFELKALDVAASTGFILHDEHEARVIAFEHLADSMYMRVEEYAKVARVEKPVLYRIVMERYALESTVGVEPADKGRATAKRL